MMTTLSKQADWDKLLRYISQKKITPIIGKEMYKFSDAGQLKPIDSYLAAQIFQNYDITDYTPTSLAGAVNYLIYNKKIESRPIREDLDSMVSDLKFDFPLLTQLLSIEDFNYYINTTVYDVLLKKKIKEIKNQTNNDINFSLQQEFFDSEKINSLTEPFVFNVFGSLTNTIDPALSENDMLEYANAFKEKMREKINIINALQSRHLLFIGCNFPDWMTRFILRLLTNEKFDIWGKERSIYIVNDNSEYRQKQFEMLQNYNVTTFEGGTEDFINELSRQWKEKNPKEKNLNTVESKRIFLSYTRKDTSAVENLKKGLEQIGNIKCWYDKRELKPGDDWEKEIIVNIREADLFIPLISTSSLEHEDGYVQKEWYQGRIEWKFRGDRERKYLIPVVIDESNLYSEKIASQFDSKLNIVKIPQGNPDGDFLNQIKEILNIN